VITLKCSRYVLTVCVTAAMLAGCGGSQPPIGSPGAMPQASAIAANADGGKSWMAPDATSQDLLYIAANRVVVVYSYPQGKLVGTLRRFYLADDGCVDKRGNVYIVNLGWGLVYEYAHGGTKRISDIDPGSMGADGCSVDPTTGNLAIAGSRDPSNGGVAIYKNARGTPTHYTDSAFYEYFFCGYDDKGNLFVEGQRYPGASGDGILAELPKGGSQLETLSTDQTLEWPGKVQWDGKHITVEDPTAAAIYQFSISGSQATEVGTTHLGGPGELHQTWIQGRTVVAPTGCSTSCEYADIVFYKYPTGGFPAKKFGKEYRTAVLGATVSLAPKR
jgi:hypothetical protein